MQLEPGTTLRLGDMIHIRGHITDFIQKVESLEVNHAPVTEVGRNDDFGLKVIEHAREHDIVYKVRSSRRWPDQGCRRTTEAVIVSLTDVQILLPNCR
jgi:hypothetical protein